MVRVVRSTVIDAPVSAVWAVVRDFNDHYRWHPAVASSYIENARSSDEIGAIRNFKLTGGQRLREQLLTLSDKDHSFRYAIVESEIPLRNYVAEVSLFTVTNGNQTFWSWQSRFDTPKGQEQELAAVVAEQVYEAGFEAVRAVVGERKRLERPAIAEVADETALSGHAMAISRYGGPEVFQSRTAAASLPQPNQVRIRQHAIGVNYIDVYCRTGYFGLASPPAILGMEAAGEVVDVGADVAHLQKGQRVAYACPPLGAYASVRTMDADLVVALPDSIDYKLAAGSLLKGITAEFLLHRVHPLSEGQIVLVHAPAGGVGHLLCQWARHLGATVIGATTSPAKIEAAIAAGAHHVITPGEMSLSDQVRELTDGHGADVIYDAVGRNSFAQSIASLAVCGHLVSYGQASGDIGNWDIGSLASCSAKVSRPNYLHYAGSRKSLESITKRLFSAIEQKILKIQVKHKYGLRQVAEAHRALQQRETSGAIVLIPEH